VGAAAEVSEVAPVGFGRFCATRRRYALVLGAALWTTWLLSVTRGPGLLDLAGNVKGADFIEFYTAGALVGRGDADRLYDLERQQRFEHALTAPQDWPGLHPFINPPFFAWPFVPLAALPYLVAFAIWSAIGVALVVATVALVRDGPAAWRALPWAFAFPPVFASVSYGQNALLSLFILAAAVALLRHGRDFAGGLVLGVLLYKPQLLVVLGIVLLADRRWWTVAGLATMAALLAAATLATGVPAAQSYLALASTFGAMQTHAGFPTWNMHSLYSFCVLLLPDHLEIATILAVVASAAAIVVVRRLQPRYDVATLRHWYAVALWGTVLASPHVFLYDLAPLLLAALLVWDDRREEELWAAGIAAVWVALAFSAPIAKLMHESGGRAIQLSTLAIASSGYVLLRDAAPRESVADG